MDRIIDKLKKLLALAERGEQGEAENARRMLEAELRHHGLTLDDIRSERKSIRILKYSSGEELTLVVQIILNYLGSKSEAFKTSTYNSRKREIYIELSDMEYVDLSNMCDFYKKHYRKERKRLISDMIHAFVQKHHLFDSTPQDNPENDRSIDWDKLMRILALSSTMEDVTFRKQISK